jgi:segregation and condensation protein A
VSAPFTVRLEKVFHGPMDLLLHLVREQEVEIHDIEIARVLEGYLEYLKALRDLDIELAGDFLVMAATLMAIKSRSLFPRDEVDLENDLDPRDELIQRLMEYRRFRQASERLAAGWDERARLH